MLNLDRDDLPDERLELDNFEFKVNVTKAVDNIRVLLSLVSSLYDSVGPLARFTLPAKIVLQQLCRMGIGWDESISKSDLKLWKDGYHVYLF